MGPNRESESTYTTDLLDCGRISGSSSELERAVRNLEQRALEELPGAPGSRILRDWDSDLSGGAGLEFCVVVEVKWRLGGLFLVL